MSAPHGAGLGDGPGDGHGDGGGELILGTIEASHWPPEWFVWLLERATLGIFLVASAVLVWGVLYGLVRFLRIEAKRLRGGVDPADMASLRRQVGFYLLFALELLIAADVIETMLSPTLEHLAVLGGIALIRIVVGYALSKELEEVARHAQPSQERESEGA